VPLVTIAFKMVSTQQRGEHPAEGPGVIVFQPRLGYLLPFDTSSIRHALRLHSPPPSARFTLNLAVWPPSFANPSLLRGKKGE